MSIFKKKLPSKKEIENHHSRIIKYSEIFKNIVVTQNCINYSKVNIESIDYAAFFYILNIYMALLEVKYSKLYINVVTKTILMNIEDNLRNNGNKIENGYFEKIYAKLSESLIQLFNIAKNNGDDGFKIIAIYFCSDELQMNNFEIDQNENMIIKIINLFNKIINLPESEF